MSRPQAKFVWINTRDSKGQLVQKVFRVQRLGGRQFIEYKEQRYQLPDRFEWLAHDYEISEVLVELEEPVSDFYCDLTGDQKLQIWCCASNNWGQSDLAPYPLTPHEAKQYCKNCYWGASFYCAAFPYSPYSSNIGGDWLRAIHGKEHLNSTHWLEEVRCDR